MDNLKFFKKVTAPRTLGFTAPLPFGEIEVELDIPDLSHCDFTVGGDWGPMYCVKTQGAEFKLIYRQRHSSQLSCTRLLLFEVEILSPMAADERERFPLYLVLPDKQRGFLLHVFFDRDGAAKKIEGHHLSGTAKLFEREVRQIAEVTE